MPLDMHRFAMISIPAGVHGFVHLTVEDVTVYTAELPQRDITKGVALTVNAATHALSVMLPMGNTFAGLVCMYGEPWVGITMQTTGVLHDSIQAVPYLHHFAHKCSVTIPDDYHGFGTANLGILSHPPHSHVVIDPYGTVVASFASPATGTLLIWPLSPKDTV